MDVDSHFLAVLFHGFPIFGYYPVLLAELIPSDGGVQGREFHHFDAIVDWADVVAEAAADAIVFADSRLGTGADCFLFAV